MKTLEALFEDPLPPGLLWSDIVRLFQGLGAEVSEGRAGRILVALNGVRAVLHLLPEVNVEIIKSVRRFLKEAGIET